MQVRNFIPPQTDEPEVFILDQDGAYTGTYGGKNGRPGIKTYFFFPLRCTYKPQSNTMIYCRLSMSKFCINCRQRV